MSDWQDYYADYSDGFASKRGSEEDALAHSDSDTSAPAVMYDAKTNTLVSVHDAVDPWSEIAKINDVGSTHCRVLVSADPVLFFFAGRLCGVCI